MKVSEALKLYRQEMADLVKPYFWSDEEIRAYAADAYRMFARLTGGITDFTSPLTLLDIVAGESTSPLDSRVLRVMDAALVSTAQPIEIINATDLMQAARNDYGIVRRLFSDKTPGVVRYMVIGRQRDIVQWVQVPEVNDQAQLSVYRLPLDTISTDGADDSFEFDEIGEEHHRHLVLWMRALGYNKHDADTFDPEKAGAYDQKFRFYCEQARAEWERYKHKTRTVSYGGI